MSEQVFLIGDLRERVVQQLAKEPHAATAAGMAQRMGLPEWAVVKGLEAARVAGLAELLGSVNGVAFWGPARVFWESARASGVPAGLSADERQAVGNISVKD